MSKKNIVIVGGGSAGVNAAKTLAKSIDASKYEIILINPLPYRVWLIATLRLTVAPQEGLKEDVLIPYDKIFGGNVGKFVEGTVASFEPSKEGGGEVTLESGEKIPYHVLLLSQGSTWTGPPGFPHTDNGVQEHIETLQTQFSQAKHIVLVGGGAVGYELAGEIKDVWPDKKVTIVHGEEHLFNPAYPAKMRIASETAIRARGVELVLGEYVDVSETKEVQGVTTRSGKQIADADLVVQTRGPRANTSFVGSSLGGDSLSQTGHILVRPTLQLKSHNDIFAAGDVIEWKEQKQAAKAGNHGTLAGSNILAYLNKKKLKEYKGATEMIVITNGKNSGLAYFDVLWGITLGAWFAKAVKSKSLLISMFKGEQGY